MTNIKKIVMIFGLCASLPFLVSATTAQLREREPRWVGRSDKQLNELIGCLGSNYVGTLSARLMAMPIDRGMSYTDSDGNRDILVDVTDDGDHRTIKLWLRSFLGITVGAKEQIEKLSACAGVPATG